MKGLGKRPREIGGIAFAYLGWSIPTVPSTPMPSLRIKLPNSDEIRHPLQGARITIGRLPDNTIQIPDRSISGHHAEIVAVNGRYCLHDLDSTNRSFVDGQPVEDFPLEQSCHIVFGNVQCEFDPSAPAPSHEAPGSLSALERDTAFLRAENSELRAKVDWLQRRLDILSSARLVTGRTDNTPLSTSSDALRAVTAEREDFRHQAVALKLELENVREESALTSRERDTARQMAEQLQSELLKLKRSEPRVAQQSASPVPPPAPSEAAEQSVAEAIAPPPLPHPEDLIPHWASLRTAVEQVAHDSAISNSGSKLPRPPLSSQNARQRSASHPFSRLAASTDELLRRLIEDATPLAPCSLRTLRHAVGLLGKLLEMPYFEEAKALARAKILAIDDDAELLSSLVASLHPAGLELTCCASSEDAIPAVEARNFDLVLLDVNLPGLDGAAFCVRTRELPAYRKTPIIFLTGADTLDTRAAASLSGGSDFVTKPFNVCDLILKVQTWTLRYQLDLL